MPYNLEIAHSVTPQAGRRGELSIAASSAQVLMRGKPEYDVPNEVIAHINRLFESALDKRISSKPTRGSALWARHRGSAFKECGQLD